MELQFSLLNRMCLNLSFSPKRFYQFNVFFTSCGYYSAFVVSMAACIYYYQKPLASEFEGQVTKFTSLPLELPYLCMDTINKRNDHDWTDLVHLI